MPDPHSLVRFIAQAYAPTVDESAPSIGPVTRHRIALVRRRLACGRYPLDARRTAEEIHAYEAGTAASHASGVAQLVIARIEAGIRLLHGQDAMVLQLEFIEGFSSQEIALTLDTTPAAIEPVRRHALDALRAALVR